MLIIVIIALLFAVSEIVGDLFMFGRPRPPFNWTSYMFGTLLPWGLVIILSGRVLGWW